MNRMNTLKILLPNRLPTDKLIKPMRTAAMETAISGSEVDAARNKVPTNDFPNPVCSAIFSGKVGQE